ncbi:fumarylacetoacetate hydrolase family protein [Pseudomonas sp. CBSPBW29]|uniref:fumarylacetoacetate hydrolase family protein n=1 Tax=Pseudomonas sp. CBS TaxID=2971912 RepID=UPI0021AD378A|nr:fumarylacetoacetate hydrolase family protein [Pseudomonas sp. CBS]WEL43644.1 fumarylacetoacetate hydrolase family protein [Pseudomonas sp. CBSPBW29]WEL64711.1 fumarylacetoacetate hydrolase family protein [Pseudomonas sp. CBSPGW29]WEL68178.1 fumarylacetoacetate hydrolase family protein [Pseudomonas sp. CBSPCGW29]WEL75199.1 fumarylacetoacetate hydrolase family protein [Pseudomonas sp. CBSPAW29]WEL80557.1 fumarylacetoacetate hydrolase family protein [Pseudomonas sp. CBSPCAW29]WEL89071.1 fumar
MIEYVIDAPRAPFLNVDGDSRQFPIRRVFCVGRNYSDHAREMGHDPDREPPFFFTKPADAVVSNPDVIAYPPLTEDLHHEVELVVAIGKDGVNISPEQALEHVWGYGVGIDLTRRDIQAQAKKMGRPWDWSKGFDESAPCSALQPVCRVGHPGNGTVWLKVNGEERQRGDLADQIWSVADVISYASRAVALKAGDLILTGTPAGVGALQVGDKVEAGIDGVGELTFSIGKTALGIEA